MLHGIVAAVVGGDLALFGDAARDRALEVVLKNASASGKALENNL
jgi:hypothetical protein